MALQSKASDAVASSVCNRCFLRRDDGNPKYADPMRELADLRARQDVHYLSFDSMDELRHHLLGQMGDDKIRAKPHLVFYEFVHRYHREEARKKFVPLALIWLEANKRRIVGRAEWIMRYRKRRQEKYGHEQTN